MISPSWQGIVHVRTDFTECERSTAMLQDASYQRISHRIRRFNGSAAGCMSHEHRLDREHHAPSVLCLIIIKISAADHAENRHDRSAVDDERHRIHGLL